MSSAGSTPFPSVRWRQRRLREGGAILAALAVYAAAFYGRLLPDEVASWITDFAWTAFSLAAGLRCLATARRQARPSRRLAWALFAASALSWTAGMLYLIAGQLLREDFMPYPTLANVFFVALAPLFTLGILAYREPEARIGLAVRRLADLGILAASAAVILIILLLESFLVSSESLFFQVFAVLDPALFATAAVFTLSAVWLRGRTGERRLVLLLAGSIGLHAFADLVYFLDQLGGGELETGFLNVYWLGAFALLYWAAVEEDTRLARAAADEPAPPLAFGLLETATPSIAIVTMVAVAFAFRENLTDRTLLVILPLLLAVGLILGFREWWSLRIGERLVSNLSEARDRIAQILAASPAVICTWSAGPELRPTFVSDNVSALLGWRPEEILAQADWPLGGVHPEDRPRVEEWLERVGRRGTVTFEYRFRHREGHWVWLLQRLELRRDARGEPRQLVGSILDASDRKRLEQQLRQSRKLEVVGQLAGGIAHDFNNLLTTVMSHEELAREALPAGHPAIADLEAIAAAGEQAAVLTRELLAFSRRTPPELNLVDLNEVAGRASEVLRRILGPSYRLEVESTSEPVVVRADTTQLEQVLLNLTLNARDAMPEGGRLVLGVERAWLDEDFLSSRGELEPGFYGVLYVADSGEGMSREVLDRMFEPFFTTKQGGKGSGLGLAVVHGVVEQHAGLIDVASRPGRGSAFRVYLPATGESAATTVSKRGETDAGGSETLLVVDDDEEILSVLAKALSARGYKIITAASAEQALARALDRRERFDLLLTDLVMPGMNGRELATSLSWERPNLKVLYMSGYADELLVQSGVRESGIRLIHKPLVPSRVARAVREALDV